MIDIHSHILPAMDDGARSFEESVAMVRLAAATGTTDIVATPHANSEYTFEPVIVDRRIRELAEATGHIIRIHRGCDFHLSVANILDAFDRPHRYTINGGRTLLVEFHELAIPPNIELVFSRFRELGITPVITHPERNVLLRRQISRMQDWVKAGCRLQITAQSFAGRFGESAKRFSMDLMDRGLVYCVASDAHDAIDRPPILSDAFRLIATEYGDDTATQVFTSNPATALNSHSA